jgi:ATP-dependent Clp protease ATP-binding subunit ClpA
MKIPSYTLSTLAVLSASTAFVPSHQNYRVAKIATAPKQLTPISAKSINQRLTSLFVSASPNVGNQAASTDQDDPLEKFGVDLTARAAEGKLDPVIGRDDEIRRAIQILSRRTKNNPVLIGEYILSC